MFKRLSNFKHFVRVRFRVGLGLGLGLGSGLGLGLGLHQTVIHFVHSPAYGYPLSLANTECNVY